MQKKNGFKNYSKMPKKWFKMNGMVGAWAQTGK